MRPPRWTDWPAASSLVCSPNRARSSWSANGWPRSPGGLSAAARLADSTGAQLAWVPRRAGERGAIEAGALPGLLPGGRPLSDETARAQVAQGWNVADLPSADGRDVDGILAAAADGSLGALLVGGIDPDDFADPEAVLAALDAAGFVVSLELRHSAVTERADVVFPIAPAAEKAGTYVNWEGRQRSFAGALPPKATPDCRVLDTLADELGIDLGFPTVAAGLAELNGLGTWDGAPGAGTGRRRADGTQTRRRRSHPGGLADAARRRATAGRRAASGGYRTHARGAVVGRDRGRDRRRRRRQRHASAPRAARSPCR